MSVRFARPGPASVAVLLGALIAPAGCQSETPLPAGVPKGAALLAEAVGPIGERDVNPEPPWEVETDGMLYLRNVNTGQVISRPVKAGQTLKVYPGWVSVGGSQVDKATGRTLPQKFVKERIVARFEPGKRYEVYYRPGLFGEALAKANGGPTSRPAADPMLVPIEPVPVFRQRDASAVERPRELAPIRPVPPREEPPVLVPVPR